MFLLHGAVEHGEDKLLATMGCTSSNVIEPCLGAVNRWFGRSDIPVGTLKNDRLLPHPGYTAEVVRQFPHAFTEGDDYPDAVTLYRPARVTTSDGSSADSSCEHRQCRRVVKSEIDSLQTETPTEHPDGAGG